LQATKVECLLCDAKVVECEETYANCVNGFKLSQELLTQMVKQLTHVKVRSSFYFQPFLISKPTPTFHCVKSLNIETCPICNENIDFNDIFIASCGHAYHLWCLLVHTISSRKCIVTNYEVFFHEGWCSLFGLSKIEVKVTKVEGSRDKGSPQVTPMTLGQNLQTSINI
jgi:hypothetical protein